MGAHPYWYFVDYQPSVQKALDELREREFRAGRYNPAMPFLEFPVDPSEPGPGAQHDSIGDACADAAEDGTRSILDISEVADDPTFCVAAPLSDDDLEAFYGTTQPSREQVEENMDWFEDLERGHCVYIKVYKNGQPNELLFAGYSFD